MIVDEQMIAGLRGSDGLCVLHRAFEPPKRYLEYAELFEQMRSRRPTILDGGAVTLTDSFSLFEKAWSGAPQANSTVAVLAFIDYIPKLPDSRVWWALRHQCGGYACRQRAMVATRLAPHPCVQAVFDRISAENYAACAGWFDSPERDADVTQKYLADIRSLELKCDGAALDLLCEGVYPVNATADVLPAVCADFADLLPLVEDVGAPPVILWLSQNSD